MTYQKTLTGIQIKGDAEGSVTAIIATLGVIDKDGDVILPGAFRGGQKTLISSYGHGSWRGEPPVGDGRVFESGTDAIFTGRFWLDTDAGKQAHGVVRNAGELQEWSFSLEDIVSEPGELNGKRVNFIKSVFVKEVSPVLRGAGVGTRTLAVKSGDLADLRRIRDDFVAGEQLRRFKTLEERRELEAIRRNVASRELGYSTKQAHFVPVGPGVVPREIVAAANAVVSFCTGHLKLAARPELVWFRPENERDAAYRKRYTAEDYDGFSTGENTVGLAYRKDNRIFIRSDLNLRETMTTVAHECRHLAQSPHVDTTGWVANEEDARIYEDAFANSYLNIN